MQLLVSSPSPARYPFSARAGGRDGDLFSISVRGLAEGEPEEGKGAVRKLDEVGLIKTTHR